MPIRNVIVTGDASGASQAAREGMLVMIVDIIDMSTTLESALDAGACAVLGCSPDNCRAPVKVSPGKIAAEACRVARLHDSKIIIITEPRVGSEEQRLQNCRDLIKNIENEKGIIEIVLPNLGAQTARLADMKNKVIVAVTDSGGVAYDAAYAENGRVITGTVARTFKQKGIQPALTAVRRAIEYYDDKNNGVAVVAASRNSMEDVLAAQFIANLLLNYQEA